MPLYDLYRRFNLLLAEFGGCSKEVLYELFKSLCLSLYGSQLWDLDVSRIAKICIAWRKCVRPLYRIPGTTNCALVPVICDGLAIDKQIYKRHSIFKTRLKCFKCIANIQNTLLMLKTRFEYSKQFSTVSNALLIFKTCFKLFKRVADI